MINKIVDLRMQISYLCNMTKDIFEYIKILLPRHRCITLPGFGAFILNRDESHILNVQKCLIPPSYSITFNSRLHHDDGILTSYLQSLRNTTYEKASKDLSIAIREMRANLLLYKEISCGTLGKIELIDSTISFAQSRDYACPIHFGLSPIGLKSIASISQNIEKETKTFSIKRKLIAASASVAAVLLFVLPSTSINDSAEQSTTQQAGYLNSLVANNTNDIQKTKVQAPAIEDFQSIVLSRNSTEHQVLAPETNRVDIVKSAPTIKSERTYYLIVGGEASMGRAENAVRKFKNEGFETAEILESPQRFRIYTQSFDNAADADRAVKTFRELHPKYQTAWIHSVRNY